MIILLRSVVKGIRLKSSECMNIRFKKDENFCISYLVRSLVCWNKSRKIVVSNSLQTNDVDEPTSKFCKHNIGGLLKYLLLPPKISQ